MIIALGYGLYRLDPQLWAACAQLQRLRGNEVHVVSMRAASNPVELVVTGVDQMHYTGGQPIRSYLLERGIKVGAWIVERPEMVIGQPPPPRDLTEPSNWAALSDRGDLL